MSLHAAGAMGSISPERRSVGTLLETGSDSIGSAAGTAHTAHSAVRCAYWSRCCASTDVFTVAATTAGSWKGSSSAHSIERSRPSTARAAASRRRCTRGRAASASPAARRSRTYGSARAVCGSLSAATMAPASALPSTVTETGARVAGSRATTVKGSRAASASADERLAAGSGWCERQSGTAKQRAKRASTALCTPAACSSYRSTSGGNAPSRITDRRPTRGSRITVIARREP